MLNIPIARIWLVVKPTVGLPIFFLSLAITSLLIHYAVLLHTTWYPALYNGHNRPPAPVVGVLLPGTETPATTLLG